MKATRVLMRGGWILWPVVLVTVATLATGCDGGIGSTGHEPLVEIPLGDFRIHLSPDVEVLRDTELPPRHQLLLRFQLHALVPSDREDDVLKRLDAREVRLRDEVIHTCRAATLDELSEPSLSTLKARLAKALGQHVGTDDIRRVVMTGVLLETT